MELIDSTEIEALKIDKIQSWDGRISLVLSNMVTLSKQLIEIDQLMDGNLVRLLDSNEFQKLLGGESLFIPLPRGLKASGLQLIKSQVNADKLESQLIGSVVASSEQKGRILLITEHDARTVDIMHGFFLKCYKFNKYKRKQEEETHQLVVMCSHVKKVDKEFRFVKSILSGIYFTRDLINEPANILNTIEFAKKLEALVQLGLSVEILEEYDLEKLGMRALLAVGRGSECPSKVAIISWNGGSKTDKPLLLVGKGVVFDSGGISIKPAIGMEEMAMDMGGAGVVAGVMKALALRKSPSNVIGLIGLVENMPDGKAQRPGDVVKTMKGDTVEVINTDAEGRLVLCDLLWYGQKAFSPKAIIDLATLTGAVIVALGHENAGVFSNNDEFCNTFIKASKIEGEGAWRLPLDASYAKLLKSRVADIANVGGRAAGSVTAAKFLENFIVDEVPWIHLDIAGVAFSKSSSKLSSSGATGWGVASLNRLISSHYESVSQ